MASGLQTISSRHGKCLIPLRLFVSVLVGVACFTLIVCKVRTDTIEAVTLLQMPIPERLAVKGIQGDLLDEGKLEIMDAGCRALESRVDMPADFVVPGGALASAHLDLARAVARRCERRLVRLYDNGDLRDERVLAWMNRLSDYLWLLARSEDASSDDSGSE